jgi:dTMP kinase
MTAMRFFDHRAPGLDGDRLPGRLIVLEGTDGVGRSTQIAMLREWLEDSGYAVATTGLLRSALAGKGIDRAKRGHTLDSVTLNLLYATDLWDRLERSIVPALRAGMVALVDRYAYSLMARAIARGVPEQWIERLLGFAVVPDKVIYLDIGVPELLPRVLANRGLEYWESGQDHLRGEGLFESFVQYQAVLLEEYRRLATRHGFAVVDARARVGEVFDRVRAEVASVVEGMEVDPARVARDALARTD